MSFQSQSRQFKRAKLRHSLFTVGPNKLTRGRLFKKHFSQSVAIHECEIHSPLWPKAFDGLRIGHVSDFHLGDLMPLDRALSVVALLKSQEPDVVACTGDIVDLYARGVEPLLDALGAVHAPLGTLMVLGNHDELDRPQLIVDAAINAGITVLQDATCTLQQNGAVLKVGGIDWAKHPRQCAQKVQHTCKEGTHLLLSHNPKAFQEAAAMSIPLTLSGHTHGGQLALPNKKSSNLAFAHKYSAGLYESNDSRLFVTVGAGAWFPLRVNCPPEVVMITMKSGKQ